ncbi:hypothetical protein [Alkalihalobacillus deserti]|nr:hypothetical protein [Alkalihalobacillus deserti]
MKIDGVEQEVEDFKDETPENVLVLNVEGEKKEVEVTPADKQY